MSRRLWYIPLFLCVAAGPVGAQQPTNNDLVAIIRAIPPPAGWQPSDSVHIFRGEDLYHLIDGGADVYFEYGFTWAASRRYASMAGNALGIEIYEMRNPESAYGIFSFLAGETGKPERLGQAGVSGDGFAIFQKERFVVCITALDSGARSAIRKTAEGVDALIAPGGRKPELVEALLRPNFHNEAVIAIRGPIGFEQRARLGLGNVFLVREGASGLFNDCRVFILRYPGAAECDTTEQHAVAILKTRGGYRQIAGTDSTRLLAHADGKLIHIERAGRHMLLTLGESREAIQRTQFMLGKTHLNSP
jgi:hypothetical protein